MPEITLLLAALVCQAGMMCLSLAMGRHYEQLTGRREVPAARCYLLRAFGWALLLLAAMACLRVLGVGVGLAAWCGLLMVAALVVACGLSYSPRIIMRISVLAVGIGGCGLGVAWFFSI